MPRLAVHKAAESEVHTGPVQVDVASLAVTVLSKVPKFLPVSDTNMAPKTGPLVEVIEDATGASYSNAIVLDPTSNPTEITVEPDRVRPEDTLLNIADDESQRETSPTEPPNTENADVSDVAKLTPRTDTTTAPLVGRLLQFMQADTSLITDGAVNECINDELLLINPTESVIPRADSLPDDIFPIIEEYETHIECSPAVFPNETSAVAKLCETILPVTVMYTALDDGARSLLERIRGPAKVKTWLSVALLLNMKDTLKERDRLDPADALPTMALSDIQVDVSQLVPATPTLLETAVSPIPEP